MLRFSSKELMLGMVVNTRSAEVDQSVLPITEQDVTTQMAYVAQQRLDGYAGAVVHAVKRKSAFDKKVLANKPGEVIFSKGQLVQVYCSDLDGTFKTERKILPKWSPSYRVTARVLNSYTLQTLIGAPINGCFSAHHLQRFLPCEGVELARAQKEVEERCRREEEEREKDELKEVEVERKTESVGESHQETIGEELGERVSPQVVEERARETNEDLEAEEDENREAEEDMDLEAVEDEDLTSEVEGEE